MTPDHRSTSDGELVALAMCDVIFGAGLLGGSLALVPVRSLAALSYAQRTAAYSIAFVAGVVFSIATVVLCGLLLVKKWREFLRGAVMIAGATAAALLLFQLGLFGRWSLQLLSILATIGATLLVAGVVLWLGWRWGGYVQIALIGAAIIAAWPLRARDAYGFALFEGLLIVTLISMSGPLMPFLVPDASGAAAERRPGRFLTIRRAGHTVSRVAFVAFVVIAATFIAMSMFATRKFRDAIERSNQKRSMADMRLITTAVEAYATDHNAYPAADDIAALTRLLEPTYGKALPRADAWGTPFGYRRVVLPDGTEGYVVRTAGADGKFEYADPTAYSGGAVSEYQRDIVFSTISPSQWPDGVMGP